jgi:hypothetical protein
LRPREEYVTSSVDRILSRFRVNKTVSTDAAFHVLVSVVSRDEFH